MFRYDGPVIEFINKLTDILLLGLIWLVMCLPIITIGASTTAAYYVAFNQLNDKDGYVLSKFFKSFKLNFKQSTIIFVLTSGVTYFAAFNLSVVFSGVIKSGNYVQLAMIIANVLVIYEAMVISYFSYTFLSKVEFTTFGLIKTSFLLGNRHILTSLLNFVISIGLVFAIGLMPLLVLFAGGIYIFLTATLMKRVLIKYKPEVFETIINDDSSFKVAMENPVAYSQEIENNENKFELETEDK